MRPCAPSIVLGMVLFATAGQAADSGAPLESTKQELRNLGSGQKAGSGPGATEGLRPSLPAIQTPGQETLPPVQLVDPEKLEKERKRKKEERKNWLVNGVEQLERQDKQKESNTVPAEESKADGNDASASDGTDPQYLLKLYDEQKKREDAHKLETKSQRSPATDPLAPFLQGWLGNSPVRGQFFDEFARKPEGTRDSGAPVSLGTSAGPHLGQSSGLVRDPGSDLAAKPNPYLAELNPPIRSELPNRGLSVDNALNPEIAAPPSSKPLMPLLTPPAEVKPPERKALPSPLADDKKYFPQLKKF